MQCKRLSDHVANVDTSLFKMVLCYDADVRGSVVKPTANERLSVLTWKLVDYAAVRCINVHYSVPAD